MKKLTFLFVFIFLFSTHSFARECEEIKKAFLLDSKPTDQDISEFKAGVETGNQCLRNLMGILLYEGKFFLKDEEEARKIFYTLSNNNYPESQFNLAWVLSKDDNQDPQMVTNILLGIHAKYIDDKKNYHLSSKAKDLGRDYFKGLPNRIYNCKFSKCKSDLKDLSSDVLANLNKNFEEGVSNVTINAGQKITAALQDQKATEDAIFAILLIGAATYSIASSAYVRPAAPPSVPPCFCEPWMQPGYNWQFPHLSGVYGFY
jgi:TPR repeat protein